MACVQQMQQMRIARRLPLPLSLLLLPCVATAAPPNIVTVVIDDMDLERVPFYPKSDAGAAEQLRLHLRSGGCRSGQANCTYSAPNIEAVGARGARFLGAHVPVSVCTPSRYAILTGRLPSSSPFYSGTLLGHRNPQVSISWNTWIEQGSTGAPCCGPGVPRPCAPARFFGCSRRSHTLGSMLQAVGYFTGFVGKWHLSPPPAELVSFHDGHKGKFPEVVTETSAAAAATLQSEFEAVREATLASSVRTTGFNYTGALSVGNVVDLAPLGLAVHNMDWEAEAGLNFLELAQGHVAAGRALGFFLHLCTTLTHSPGPKSGVCADPRLSEGGLLSRAPVGMPSRSSVFERTGGRRCSWPEYDAAHTLWVDDAIGAPAGLALTQTSLYSPGQAFPPHSPRSPRSPLSPSQTM